MFAWEALDDDKNSHTSSHRLIVPGGWIIRTTIVYSQGERATCAVDQIFISDPDHEWRI